MSLERPFLKTLPCVECVSVPDDGRCPCAKHATACEVAGYARESAAGIRRLRHITDESRAELASCTADALDNALNDVGARLDDRAFLMACGATVAAKAVAP